MKLDLKRKKIGGGCFEEKSLTGHFWTTDLEFDT